jgi:hypothetical protein
MPTKVLTPEELLSKASAMVPILKDRAAHTEELCRIPDETVQDLLSSGLCLMAFPNVSEVSTLVMA